MVWLATGYQIFGKLCDQSAGYTATKYWTIFLSQWNIRYAWKMSSKLFQSIRFSTTKVTYNSKGVKFAAVSTRHQYEMELYLLHGKNACWNKSAIFLYVAEYNTLTNWTKQRWHLMKQCINLWNNNKNYKFWPLSYIYEVIPYDSSLKQYLDKNETT